MLEVDGVGHGMTLSDRRLQCPLALMRRQAIQILHASPA
jgi:hypothetical protein